MIALRPPEYFPGLAYMALVQRAGRFVLADTLPYRRRTMQNRGRLRTPQGWQWISVPLKGGQRGRPIAEVRLENRERWLVKHWRSFQYNYRSTPYFEFYEPEVKPFFEREWTHLGALTCASVELLAGLMDLPTPLVRASRLPGAPRTAAAIEEALRASGETAALRVPASGRAEGLSEAEKAGGMFHFDAPTYRQNFEGFEPGMSAADLLFNLGPEAAARLREGCADAATS